MENRKTSKNNVSTAFSSAVADQPSPTSSTPIDDGKRVPGQSSMWIFVFGDLFIFGGWFAFYMMYRMQAPDTFLQSQRELSQTIGVINTLILLLSSLFIAQCVKMARTKDFGKALNYTYLTFGCGVVFAASKIYEWTDKFQGGFTPVTNEFFMFYYFLTAVHVFHVLCGFIVLGVVIRELMTPEFRSQEVVETGATYWHMVDMLWVIIFALVYLMR